MLQLIYDGEKGMSLDPNHLAYEWAMGERG